MIVDTFRCCELIAAGAGKCIIDRNCVMPILGEMDYDTFVRIRLMYETTDTTRRS